MHHILELWCLFYTLSPFQFGLTAFQGLSVWLPNLVAQVQGLKIQSLELLASCVTLGKLLNRSVLRFLYLENGAVHRLCPLN